MFRIKKSILLKTIGYRVLSTILTAVIAFAITGSLELAFAIGAWDTAGKVVFYYLYEDVFNRIFYWKVEPCVVWMTGLSGAGKTTIAREMKEILGRSGNKVVLLDGDEIRNMFPSTGFDLESRRAHNKRVAYMASLLKEQGSVVIVSLISPMEDSRREAKSLCGGRFFETYISTALEVCEGRDVKGLYKKVRSGELKNFTGVDSPFEAPEFPDIGVGTIGRTPRECADQVIREIR